LTHLKYTKLWLQVSLAYFFTTEYNVVIVEMHVLNKVWTETVLKIHSSVCF